MIETRLRIFNQIALSRKVLWRINTLLGALTWIELLAERRLSALLLDGALHGLIDCLLICWLSSLAGKLQERVLSCLLRGLASDAVNWWFAGIWTLSWLLAVSFVLIPEAVGVLKLLCLKLELMFRYMSSWRKYSILWDCARRPLGSQSLGWSRALVTTFAPTLVP